ncbi:MAG TPA: TonB-dependent receptor [Candidatus Limnocylindria bacterium]|nr:TonB-dependent receptor [Candidatus Limnocylindria bacterium]
MAADAQAPAPVPAVDAAPVTIHGTLVDQRSGRPIAGATVVAYRNGARVGTAVTDARGTFAIAASGAGAYSVSIAASGYAGARSSELLVPAGQAEATFRLAAAPQEAQAARTIGSVSTSAQALQTSATVSRDVAASAIGSENYPRVGDALVRLPGVDNRSGSAALGDDVFLDIRGLKPSETQTLLDGHPIGPIGVQGGTSGGYDYEDSPLFALRGVQVTYGAGALGLYGTDSTGGTIDLQTIDPTAKPEGSLEQRFGTFGESSTVLRYTGTNGKLGYALVHGVLGSYGLFHPGEQLQSGNLNATHLTPADYAANTYAVSGDNTLRDDLLKLRYTFSPSTTLTITGFAANTWEDKTGTGNNYSPYDYQLYNTLHSKLVGTCAAGGVLVTVAPGQNACWTPQQYAAATSGPTTSYGWQAIGNQDYHARLTTQAGNHALVVDAFADAYAGEYNRNQTAYNTALGFATGPFNSNFYHTTGLLLSDDIAMGNNLFGFGLYQEHQRYSGNNYAAPVMQANGTYSAGELVDVQTQNATVNNVFIRDEYTPTARISVIANAWLKHDTATVGTSLDPRASLLYHADASDVIRLTAGKSTGQPDPSLTAGSLVAPSSLNPACASLSTTHLLNVGTVGNTGLQPETASDYEIAYGHHFGGDNQIQVDLYDTHETNQLFNANLPALQFGAGAIPASILQMIQARIEANCGDNFAFPASGVAGLLSLSQASNAASELARGIEISGRIRANRHLSFDYTYDVQSAAQYDVPAALLMTNPYVINGAQIAAIPLHKASLGIDVGARNIEARLDGSYVGDNNALARGAYTFFDLGVTGTLTRRTTLNVGVRNLFNEDAGLFALSGEGEYVAENAFFHDPSAMAQGTKLRMLTPRSISIGLTQHF